MKSKTYDLYVSLGSVCSCSTSLRKSYLQFWSYPFDWLSQCNIVNRCKIIANNFEGWLEKDDLVFIGTRQEPEPKNIFQNKKNKFVYNHDFKIDTPLEDCYDEVVQKYNRRIERLSNQITNSKRVCFVYVDTPERKEPISDEDLVTAQNILQEKFKDTEIDILYLFINRELDFKDRRTTKITNRITKIEYDFDIYDTKNIQLVNVKAVVELLKQYSITNKFVTPENRRKKRIYRLKVNLEKIFHLTSIFYKGKRYKQLTLFGYTKRLKEIKD